MNVTLKKYTVRFHEKGPSPVFIEKDTYGAYGGCDECGIPLRWFRHSGWIHPDEAASNYRIYRDEIELDKHFFTKETE